MFTVRRGTRSRIEPGASVGAAVFCTLLLLSLTRYLTEFWVIGHRQKPSFNCLSSLEILHRENQMGWLRDLPWLQRADHYDQEFDRGDAGRAVEAWKKIFVSGRRVQRAASAYKIGCAYVDGTGMSQDYLLALEWWKRAADFGTTPARFTFPAMYNIAYLYFNGFGVDLDCAEAFKWNLQAAEGGYPDAQADLGFQYEEGRGVPQDNAKALAWYRLAGSSKTASGEYVGVFEHSLAAKERDAASAILKELRGRVHNSTEWELDFQMNGKHWTLG